MSAANPASAEASSLFEPQGLSAAAKAIALRNLTCVELVERCLARAASTEEHVSAWLRLDPESALDQARLLDRELANTGPRSVLYGIPVAVKDVIDVAGLPTTAASRVIDAQPAKSDADIVKVLRGLGAVVLGKTNTHEFAYGATTPPTRNPADPLRIAGGSSGGSAAAVAAGSALLGIGSDTGGSVRLPAALCGIAGWRPLRHPGIGLKGIIPLAAEFDEWGLMAASAADLALVGRTLRGTRLEGKQRCEVVVPADPEQSMPGLAPEVADAFAFAVERLSAGGTKVISAALPDLSAWRGPRMAIQMRQVLQHHCGMGWWPHRRHLYSEESRLNLEMAEARKAEELEPYRQQLRSLDAAIDALLDGSRVLAVPTVPVVAPAVKDLAEMRRRPGERHPLVGLLSLATLPFSRGDLTSLTGPIRGNRIGLPIGIQFVAREESQVFEVASRLEDAVA